MFHRLPETVFHEICLYFEGLFLLNLLPVCREWYERLDHIPTNPSILPQAGNLSPAMEIPIKYKGVFSFLIWDQEQRWHRVAISKRQKNQLPIVNIVSVASDMDIFFGLPLPNRELASSAEEPLYYISHSESKLYVYFNLAVAAFGFQDMLERKLDSMPLAVKSIPFYPDSVYVGFTVISHTVFLLTCRNELSVYNWKDAKQARWSDCVGVGTSAESPDKFVIERATIHAGQDLSQVLIFAQIQPEGSKSPEIICQTLTFRWAEEQADDVILNVDIVRSQHRSMISELVTFDKKVVFPSTWMDPEGHIYALFEGATESRWCFLDFEKLRWEVLGMDFTEVNSIWYQQYPNHDGSGLIYVAQLDLAELAESGEASFQIAENNIVRWNSRPRLSANLFCKKRKRRHS